MGVGCSLNNVNGQKRKWLITAHSRVILGPKPIARNDKDFLLHF